MSHPTSGNVLTAAGRRSLHQRLEQAQRDLDQLLTTQTGHITANDTIDARANQLRRKIAEFTAVLEDGVNVEDIDEDPTIVELGDEVDIEGPDGARETYALVHPAEASVSDGRISHHSPLGQAMLGAKVNDDIVVEAPAGPYTCTIKARRRLT